MSPHKAGTPRACWDVFAMSTVVTAMVTSGYFRRLGGLIRNIALAPEPAYGVNEYLRLLFSMVADCQCSVKQAINHSIKVIILTIYQNLQACDSTKSCLLPLTAIPRLWYRLQSGSVR